MNDFMQWLYANYIWPQIKDQPTDDGDTMRLSILEGDHTADQMEDIQCVLRFYASHAFLLGLRLGIGLSPELGHRAT